MDTPNKTSTKIIIVGGGFGGAYVCQELLKRAKPGQLQITVISEQSHILVTPLLIDHLGEKTVSERSKVSLKEFLGSVPLIVQAHVETVNLDQKIVTTAEGNYSYDYLVMACGSTTNFQRVAGAEEHCLPFKSFADAERIIAAITTARNQSSKRRPAIVIVGGGPAGIELAAKLHELFGGSNPDNISIEIVDVATTVLPTLPHKVQDKARHILKKLGISFTGAAYIDRIDPTTLYFKDGTSRTADVIIWTAGVKAIVPTFIPDITPDGQRLSTNNYLQIPKQSLVYALGDMSQYSQQGDLRYTPTAQSAVQQSRTVAKNILRDMAGQELRPYHYHNKGIFIPLGKLQGVGVIGSLIVYGSVPWLGWKLFGRLNYPKTKHRLPNERQ